MSFRQYGGINYAARNNIVKNNYSNANNLSVMTKVGQPSSIINFESDLSANIIYSDLTVDNLTVKYNSNHKGILTVSDINSTSGIMYITNDITEPTSTLRIISNGTNNYIQSGRTSETKSAADLHFTDMNDENRWMTIKSDGKVGIGFGKDGIPDKILDVNGDALINGLTIGRGGGSLYSNTALGYNALTSNVSSESNVAIGYNALFTQKTSGTTDENGIYLYNGDNTAIGVAALYWTDGISGGGPNTRSGAWNTAVGLNALVYNTTGSYNTAIGLQAGCYFNNYELNGGGPRTADRCTFLGAESRSNYSDPIQSTAIGYNSVITANNQIMLGTSSETVQIPGDLRVSGLLTANSGCNLNDGDITFRNTTGNYNNNIRQIFFDNGSTDSAYIKFVSVSGDNSYLEIETIDDRVPIHFTVNGTSIQEYGRMTLNTNGLSINYEQSSPQSTYALDVNGKLKVVNDALINGLTVGRGGGNLDSNTAFGHEALFNNGVGGYSNTAIGYQALLNNNGGYSNTAIGNLALLKNEGYYTSEIDFGGLANTAIGDQALTNNIKGNYNIALGTGALLYTNSTGNIGIGINTLLYNDTGNYNVAIGSEAGTTYPPPNQIEPVGPKNCTKCTFIGAYSGNTTVGDFISSTAIGSESQITANHQITLGTSLETVYIPGKLSANSSSTNDYQGAFYNSVIGEGTLLSANGDITEIKMNNNSGTHFSIQNTNNSFRIRNSSSNHSPYTDDEESDLMRIISDTKETIFYGKCTAGSFDIYSDYRIKENVLSLVDDSSFIVDNLRPVTYKNILSGKQDMGFIAHELQEQYPFLVSGEKDGTEKQSVNYIGLIALLVKEIQELKQDIKILKTNL